MTVAAVVLAAGGGTRFAGDTHKLVAELRGRRVIDRVLDEIRRAGLDAVYVVVGAADLDLPADVVVVRNERWAEGMATSLAAGVEAARAGGHDAVVVGLGDSPGILAEAWRRVATATDTPVAVATYDGVRRHPVRFAANVWNLLPTTGDVGARELLGSGIAEVAEIRCPGSPADIDTVEDLKAWS